MQTELYKVFYTTATLGNITHASKQLFISQPAISKSIKSLEDQIGCTLFIRHAKGVTLTTEGKILFEYVKKAFEYLTDGELVLEKLKSLNEGLIQVGISNTLCKYFFVPHLRSFHQLHPQIKIRIYNRSSTETLELLKKGAIDFGIVSIKAIPQEFEFLELVKIQDIFVTNQKELATRELISVKKLQEFPLMMLEKNNTTRVFLDHFFSENGASLQPELEISSMDFLIEFATIGLGIAAVVKNFVDKELREETLFELPVVPPMPSRSVGIVYLKDLPQSVAMKVFVEHLLSNSLCSG